MKKSNSKNNISKKIKVLIYAPAFLPNIGGFENVVHLIANGLKEHVKLIIVTNTPNIEKDDLGYEVIRCPNPIKLFKLVKWCDIYFQHNVSLKGIYPLLFFKRKLLITHHGYYTRSNGSIGWQDLIKRNIAKYIAHNLSISSAVARDLGTPSTLVANPYDTSIFNDNINIEKTKDLIFVGRLVSDKGVNILLTALDILKAKKLYPRLTIVGTGPEETTLKNQVNVLKLETQVDFLGSLRGSDLARELSKHKILVIPSLWNEPFGIVALEGIACGCYVIGSEGGGLKDAIGPCGQTFKNGDSNQLAGILEEVIFNENIPKIDKKIIDQHLAKHNPKSVALQYLNIISGIL